MSRSKRLGKQPAVVIWLGYAIWWEHPGAELGCFFASLAVVGTPWGDQPPSGQVGWSGEARGSHGGAPGSAALTFAPGRSAGAVFFQGGALEAMPKQPRRCAGRQAGAHRRSEGSPRTKSTDFEIRSCVLRVLGIF
jgi:hypothetical protein